MNDSYVKMLNRRLAELEETIKSAREVIEFYALKNKGLFDYKAQQWLEKQKQKENNTFEGC